MVGLKEDVKENEDVISGFQHRQAPRICAGFFGRFQTMITACGSWNIPTETVEPYDTII